MAEESTEEDQEGRPGWVGLVLPALTFVVGLVLGGVLVYATSGGDAAREPEADPSATTAPPEPGETVVTLPAACQEASAQVSEAYRLLRQAVDQVRDFQADRLVQTLEELQTVDEQTRALVERCSQISVDTGPTTESPTQSPAG